MRQTKLNKNCSLYKKIYFLKIFRLYITHQNALFNGLLPPPEVGGELVFDHKMPPPPRLSSSPPGSAWWHTAVSFLWVTGNTLPRTYQAKILYFWEPGSRRRPTKWAHHIWSLIDNFFTRVSFSCRMPKIVLIGTWWASTSSLTVTRHPSQRIDFF